MITLILLEFSFWYTKMKLFKFSLNFIEKSLMRKDFQFKIFEVIMEPNLKIKNLKNFVMKKK